jgi:septum formation protein
MRFVLASASPARLATLRAAGVKPDVVVSDVDESAVRAATTSELVARLAEAKAGSVAAALREDAFVLGCDSLLELDGATFGKPGTYDAAVSQWQRMRGRVGVLHTGHALVRCPHGEVRTAVDSAAVQFGDVTDSEIAAYVGTGEPLHVAGAFTVDGLGGWFIERIDGDYHTVVGVSLPLLRRLLAEFGVSVAELWRRAGSVPPAMITPRAGCH